MNKNILKFNVLSFSALLIFALSFTGCKEDAIIGCTNPDAENYDAAANEDGGDCSFASDKFVGAYSGLIGCPGILGFILNSDTFPFEIDESLSGIANEVKINLTDLSIVLDGVVDGNRVSIDTTVPAYPIDTNMDGETNITADLIVTGFAEIDAGETSLAGELNILVRITATMEDFTEEVCTFSGEKI